MKTNLTTDTKAILINGVPFAFNSIYVRVVGENVALYHQYTMSIIVDSQNYAEYLQANVPSVSLSNLLTFLTTNAFK